MRLKRVFRGLGVHVGSSRAPQNTKSAHKNSISAANYTPKHSHNLKNYAEKQKPCRYRAQRAQSRIADSKNQGKRSLKRRKHGGRAPVIVQ
jgi:hypothetical protein